MRRTVFVAIAVLTGVLLQTTVFSEIRLLGARPELMYLLTTLVAFYDAPEPGAITGFASGMAQDFLMNQPKGITALVLTLLGWFVGVLRPYIVSSSPYAPIFVVALATFAGQVFYGLVAFLLGQFDVSPLYLLRVAGLSAVYNGLLAPLVAPLVRRAVEAGPARGAGRW
ncbi:MAG: rod shape-determining protein MreD [Actinomycetota bacterium]